MLIIAWLLSVVLSASLTFNYSQHMTIKFWERAFMNTPDEEEVPEKYVVHASDRANSSYYGAKLTKWK